MSVNNHLIRRTAITALLVGAAVSACSSTPDDVATTASAFTTTSAATSVGESDSEPTPTSPSGEAASVVQVFDGDSLLVVVEDTEIEVRLLGVNAPEGDECHGDAARTTLEQLLSNVAVTLVAGGEDTDQFGRLLRYLYVDGLNINLALVANGDALALQTDHDLRDQFTTIGDASAAEGLGMWSAGACGDRSDTPSVEIVDYVYNPSGRDEDNMNGEWVALENRDSGTVDMSGWTIRDESTRNRFTFPQGFELGAGEEVIVRTGCGTSGGFELFWCADDPVWSNGGDTVILQLSDGTVADHDRFNGDF